VDIVSKNGNLLLNLPLQPEGTLDSDARRFLDQFGAWMRINAEAIFETRPWKHYGEGPTRIAGGQFAEDKNESFTPEDFRFTANSSMIYAIALGWPETEFRIRSPLPKLAGVEMLGAKQALRWRQDEQGLTVTIPEAKPCKYAYTLRLSS
jgi:alpha-L-fucosidase